MQVIKQMKLHLVTGKTLTFEIDKHDIYESSESFTISNNEDDDRYIIYRRAIAAIKYDSYTVDEGK